MKRVIASVLIGISLYAQEAQQASKGARIEATFIIQNKHNTLLEHMQKIKKELEQASIVRKKLIEERQPLIEKYQKLEHDYKSLLRQRNLQARARKLALIREQKQELASLLLMLDRELHHAQRVEELYPQYSKELDLLSLGFNKFIGDLAEAEYVLSDDIKKEVQKAFVVRDKVELEAHLMDLLCELEKHKVTLKNKERTLLHKERKLQELQQGESSKKKEDLSVGLQKEIVYLKTSSARIRRSIAQAQKTLEELRVKALKVHTELYKDKKNVPFTERLLLWKR